MQTYNLKTWLVTLSAGLLILSTLACSQGGAGKLIEAQIVPANEELQKTPEKSIYNINAYPLNKLVCDPFDPTPVPTPKHGIKSSLWFRGFNQPIYYSVMDYILNYRKSDQNLFFNSVNVPTRMFYDGFPIESGDVVRDDLGTQLIEYFSMKFESQITLGEGDTEGQYELAVLSDDGTVLKLKDSEAPASSADLWETHINNDGNTPTRMKCSSRIINMSLGKKIPIELLYYQGPRYHISNMLIWRKASVAGQDVLCGQSGNKLFFDPNNNSAPLKWNDLAARGWKVLESKNFLLPETDQNPVDGTTDYNACYSGSIPVISGFQVIEQLSNAVSFSWNTDILAVSQLLITNLDTGEKTVTQTDNVLRTSHQIMISNLQNNTNYRFQVIAISADLGRAISAALDLKTF